MGLVFVENNKRTTTRCFCWDGKPKCQRQSVMGEFRGLEAGQQKPVPEADGDLRAKADAERGLLLLYEVLRGMAALSRPRKSTHPPTYPPHQKKKNNKKTASLFQHDEISGTKSQYKHVDDVMMESRGVIPSRSH